MSRFFIAILLGLFAVNSANASIMVGTKLSLAIDVSGSIDATEYSLMMNGYKNAFLNAQVRANILSQNNGIAVNVVQFGQTAAVQGAGWYHLNSLASIDAFANFLGTLGRDASVGGWTNIAKGMEVSRATLVDGSAFSSSRLVMDVSGDGIQNRNLAGNSNVNPGDGATLVQTQRNAAALQGIKVNGLAITTPEFPNLDVYFTNNVKTSDGFVVKANNFADFEAAVLQKIVAETHAIPEPGSFLVWGVLGLAAAGFSSRRRKS